MGQLSDDVLREALQELYEQAPCGFIITLPDGTFTRVNQTFLGLTGYEQHELVSAARFQDLLTVPSMVFYENQYAPLLRMQGSVKEVAFDLRRKGRPPLPVLLNSVQRLDERGQPLLVASAIFDATDRRQYERELLAERRKAEELAAIVAFSSDAILSASADGSIRSFNRGAERLFGYSGGEIIGRNLGDLLAPAGGEAGWGRMMRELRAGRAVVEDMDGTGKDGENIEVSAALTPVPGPLGELSGISAVVRDVSGRREAERLQQEFLAMASHELRHPVTAIKGYAQLMHRRGTYTELSVETILKQAERLERLIGDLMMAAQIEARRLDLRPVEADLVAEARAAVQQMLSTDRPIHLEAVEEPVPVLVDRERLGQVLANLLSNAGKYSPAGSEIWVRVARGDGEASVEVSDRGVGIPADALPHLFSRFYRVAATSGGAKGLGLGLYICRELVEAHGGWIGVESEPGVGSTFTVRLPLRGS